jgi:Protein of unknown function (DUF775)
MEIDPNSFHSSFPIGNCYSSNNANPNLLPQSVSGGNNDHTYSNNNNYYPQQQSHPVFGLIVPGCPVRTDFIPVVDTPGAPITKFSITLSCPGDINVPLMSITDVVLFATTAPGFTSQQHPLALPPDCGVLCYWQISSSETSETTGFALFGALTSTQPSALYRTGWSEHEQIVSILQQQQLSPTNNASIPGGTPTFTLTIGLSMEPIANVQNLLGDTSGIVVPHGGGGGFNVHSTNNNTSNNRLYVAQKIALDLFRFMQSFDNTGNGNKSNGQPTMMTVPHNIFDRWYQRFENRFRRDPNFFLKPNE